MAIFLIVVFVYYMFLFFVCIVLFLLFCLFVCKVHVSFNKIIVVAF